MKNNRSSTQSDSSTLRLEGALFVADMLKDIMVGRDDHQTVADYAIPKGLQLHDEYGRAYKIAKAEWKWTKAELAKVRLIREQTAKRTLAFVQALLKDCLGYTDVVRKTKPVVIDDHSYPISLMTCGGTVPVVVAPSSHDITAPHEDFAIEGGGGRRKSPVQLLQLFLNASEECTWGIVTNGRVMRLLRDSASLTRPCYFEVDLQAILEADDLYYEFRALWFVLHASRGMPVSTGPDKSSACIWEMWRNSGHEQGIRVRDGLRNGVTVALRALGEGFLTHSANAALLEKLDKGELLSQAYYQQLLRLIYRLFFLFTAEERGILHPESQNDSVALAARELYDQGYALKRLSMRALRRKGYDDYEDLWVSLQIVMRGLCDGEQRLALPALGGLFDNTQCPDIDSCALNNNALLSAIYALRWAKVDGTLARVDYRNMGPEELGSVYESLLELVPDVNAQLQTFRFIGDDADDASTAGNERKTTGSYYTPDCLVRELIKTALEPVIASRLRDADDPEKALLSISVIDPAMGSGHFLLSAARRLAEELATLRAPEGAATDSDYRIALRDVISHCIYGVDRNPMAVELARTALWLEGFEPGRPLSFLDHHLVCGDALLGVMDLDSLLKGIPKEAYKALSGDDKKLCSTLSKRNAVQLKEFTNELKSKFVQQELTHQEERKDLSKQMAWLDALPDETPGQIEAKNAAYISFLESARNSHPAHAADLYMSAFLMPKDTFENASLVPTTVALRYELTGGGVPADQAVKVASDAACRNARVFHWPLAFPHIFAKGGFDCVLANPPWERIKLQEQEFFAARSPLIAQAKNKAERAKRIEWLSEGVLASNLDLSTSGPEHISSSEIALFKDFISEKRLAESASTFAHLNEKDGGRYPLTGVGDVNTYALFAESIEILTSKIGRAGFIVPSGIATDDSTKRFFSWLVKNKRLFSLIGFDNARRLFAAVHPDTPFSLLTLGHDCNQVEMAHYILSIDQLAENDRRFILKPEDFARINPNTCTCPVFRSCKDAELTSKIYENVPVLIREPNDDDPGNNPWNIKFSTMFHMSNDSYLFKDAAVFNDDVKHNSSLLPLYEAKMIHQFDHRWATYSYDEGKENSLDVTLLEKQDPDFSVRPRYYVEERQVLAKIADVPSAFAKAYADNDEHSLLIALANWVDATESLNVGEPIGIMVQSELIKDGPKQLSLFGDVPSQREPLGKRYPLFSDLPKGWQDDKLQIMASKVPLTAEELNSLKSAQSVSAYSYMLMDERSPRWLMGWRDITNATNERTVIASILPRVAVGNKIPLFLFSQYISPSLCSAFLGCANSLVLDYIARQKMGGTTLNFFIMKQFPVLALGQYSKNDLVFIVPRVLELTYTSNQMRLWAEEIWAERDQWQEIVSEQPLPEPYSFDEDRRAQLRAELDAYYARLYGITRDDLRYILDPSDVMGPDYPSETFRVLKNKELNVYGEYRTQRLVLKAWDDQEML